MDDRLMPRVCRCCSSEYILSWVSEEDEKSLPSVNQSVDADMTWVDHGTEMFTARRQLAEPHPFASEIVGLLRTDVAKRIEVFRH